MSVEIKSPSVVYAIQRFLDWVWTASDVLDPNPRPVRLSTYTNTEDCVVTELVDGLPCQLVFGMVDGRPYGALIYPTGRMYQVAVHARSDLFQGTVLLIRKAASRLHVYDLRLYCGERVNDLSFTERYTHLQACIASEREVKHPKKDLHEHGYITVDNMTLVLQTWVTLPYLNILKTEELLFMDRRAPCKRNINPQLYALTRYVYLWYHDGLFYGLNAKRQLESVQSFTERRLSEGMYKVEWPDLKVVKRVPHMYHPDSLRYLHDRHSVKNLGALSTPPGNTIPPR